MNRLRLTVPENLSVTSFTTMNEPITEANAGVIYWIQKNCPNALCIPGDTECYIQFKEVWNMVQFKRQFGIDFGGKKHGGMRLKLVYVTNAMQVYNDAYCRKLMLSQHELLHYELRYMEGWFKLHIPISGGKNSVYHIPLKQMSSMRFVNQGKKRYGLEDLVDLAHELRQVYVPAPIKLRTASYEYIDVTDREPIEIALLR